MVWIFCEKFHPITKSSLSRRFVGFGWHMMEKRGWTVKWLKYPVENNFDFCELFQVEKNCSLGLGL